MITMKRGENEKHREYVAYKKELPDGYIIKCAYFESLGKYLGCIEFIDPKNPKGLARKDLGEGACHEYWKLAKAFVTQEQTKEKSQGSVAAIQGEKFTIEWYYDIEGKSQAHEYYKASSSIQQEKMNNLLGTLANTGRILGENRFRSEGDGIYAFKPQPDRYLCFFDEKSKVIVTNAFEKRKDKMSESEKNIAKKAMIDYLKKNDTGRDLKK